MSTDSSPAPYVAIPTKEWDGVDGNWSTFRISVGRPRQDFRVLVSTQAPAPFVPIPEGCKANGQDCPQSRGVELVDGEQSRGFQMNESKTWNYSDIYNLNLETNLDFDPAERGYFGFDNVRLEVSQNADAVQVNNTLVAAYPSPSFWMGLLGLNNKETKLRSDAREQSFIKRMNETGQIPSLSYGYTAGAYYRYKSVPGSLVIGGYDASRFNHPPYSFTMAETLDRLLVVGLQSIYTNFSLTGLGTQTLANSHMSLIDSTISHLWLPEDACEKFASAFGLMYDEDTTYYLINDTTHNRLLANNPILTFKLANSEHSSDANDNVQITLPYAAFDLYIGAPTYPNGTRRYFPIRRAKDDTQYTIGRVFLQEAYLTVDYERKNFSLAQANFSATMPDASIQTIHSINYGPPASSTSLSSGAKAGIAIGTIAGILLLFSVGYLYWWRPRKQKKIMHNKRPSVASQAPTYLSSVEPPLHYYREGKEPYDPHFGAQQQQQQQHMGYERQRSVSEMPAGADNQARRPELDGVNVGGSSYELPAPVKEREEDVVVYEMGVGHEAASDVDQDNAEVGNEQAERRGSEQRRPSESARPSQVEIPPA